MKVSHEVTSACGKKVTVEAQPVSDYKKAEDWIKAHEAILRVAFSAVGAAAAVVTHVRIKPPKQHM